MESTLIVLLVPPRGEGKVRIFMRFGGLTADLSRKDKDWARIVIK